MPNSITYKDYAELDTTDPKVEFKQWTIPPLSKWISGDALPTYAGGPAHKTLTLTINGVVTPDVPMTTKGQPYDIAEGFRDLSPEFRVFLDDLLTKFFNMDLNLYSLDTENMDFSDYHGSWSASDIVGNFVKPQDMLDTYGLYLLIPDTPAKIKTEGVQVMYRQAQTMNMQYYHEMREQHTEKWVNEIVTIIFPPILYDHTTQQFDDRAVTTKKDWIEYDTEPISAPWLDGHLRGRHVLMVLGVKRGFSCLNWNASQLTQLLSKITLSSRAS